MRLVKTGLIGAMCGVMLGGFVTSASALQVDWDYSLSEWFTSATFGPDERAEGAQAVHDSLLVWGANGGNYKGVTPYEQSALELQGDGGFSADAPATTTSGTWGKVVTNSVNPLDIGIGPSLTHFNNVISDTNETLKTATLHGELTLSPTTDPDMIVSDFDILFMETTNNANPCFGGGSPSGACPDLFVLADPSSLTKFFSYDGANYVLQIFELNNALVVLDDATCDAIGVAHGCVGFFTAENAQTTAQFGFAIRAVPEPATIALLGAGLLGLGLARRRRR